MRALKRQQIALEQERKDLLDRVERQQSLIDSLQKKSGDKAQTGKQPILPQSPLQQMIGAMADTASTGETEKKDDRQQPGPRSSESLREELDRWLNDSTNSVQDEPTEKAPILLCTPSTHGRIDDLPVFSDDEEERARKETKLHDWTPHQSKDISSRIAEHRKSLTLSMEKSHDSRSLKASAEKSERERTTIDSAKKDQMQTVKTTLNYGDECLV